MSILTDNAAGVNPAKPNPCRKHAWKPAFPGPPDLVTAWHGGGNAYRFEQFQQCQCCHAHGLKSLQTGKIRTLPPHEVAAYDVEANAQAWRQHIELWRQFFAEEQTKNGGAA